MTILLLIYEDRNIWIQNRKGRASLAVLENLSKFLTPPEDIKKIYDHLQNGLSDKYQIILVEIGDFPRALMRANSSSEKTIFWNLTDGIGIYKGSHVPSIAEVLNFDYFGSKAATQHISQDKFQTYCIARNLGIRVPATSLYVGNERHTDDITSYNGGEYFVKPSCLDNNIGIQEDSKANSLAKVNQTVARIFKTYKVPAVVQEYIEGVDVRVSFIANDKHIEKLGIYKIDRRDKSGNKVEFRTENAELIEDISRVEVGRDSDWWVAPLREIRENTEKIVTYFGISDFFSIDFRVSNAGKPYFLEFNTGPFLLDPRFVKYASDLHQLDVLSLIGKALAAKIGS